MKKLFALGALSAALSISGIAYASDAEPASKAPAAPDMNQVSYVIGYEVGTNFQKQGIEANASQFEQGFEDGLHNKDSAISKADAQKIMMNFQEYMSNKMEQAQKQLAAQNQQASDAFLTKIAAEPGVQKIEDGLYYKVITAGTGDKPKATDTVVVDYEGSLPNGKVFDSSYQRHQPLTIELNQVIPGWTHALTQMPVGSTWVIYIAPKLAYGSFAPPVIGPNQALVFKVNLLSIKSAKAAMSS